MATKATGQRVRKPRRDWRVKFLSALNEGSTVSGACQAAKISRSHAYRERQRNEDFAVAWHDVEEAGTDALEKAAVARALDGSDQLLIFLLKTRRPDKYRETSRHEHAHEGEITQTVEFPNGTEWLCAVAEVTGRLPAAMNDNGNGHHGGE